MMVRRVQWLMSALAVAFVFTAWGCGSGHGYRPVTGTVKYSDGSLPKAEMATVTFEPEDGSAAAKGASGDIAEDGTFELTTIDPGDGAAPGDYRVTVKIMDGYPDPKFAVANEFTDPALTPLKATVKPSGENHFDFEVEKP